MDMVEMVIWRCKTLLISLILKWKKSSRKWNLFKSSLIIYFIKFIDIRKPSLSQIVVVQLPYIQRWLVRIRSFSAQVNLIKSLFLLGKIVICWFRRLTSNYWFILITRFSLWTFNFFNNKFKNNQLLTLHDYI